MEPKQKQFVALLCLISIIFSYSLFSLFSFATEDENSNVLKYEVNEVFAGSLKHVIQISNPTFNRMISGKLLVPIIRNETTRHYTILYNISSSVKQPTIVSDNSGNLYACWNDILIGGKQTFTVELNYHVLSFSIRYVINPNLIMDYDTNSDFYKKYTQTEELIQSNNPKIISKALNLTSGESNIHEKISKIYNYVITHLHYVAQDKERGALWALENEVGDCSEYSYLFVALCRAAGIPTRVQAGFAFHSIKDVLNDGHMWAEYYLENYGWIPVDATWRLFDSIDYKHFSSIQSMPEFMSYANYVFDVAMGPEPLDEQNVQLQKSSSSLFGENSFIEDTFIAAQKINQAKFVLFLAKNLGSTLLFSSEVSDAEQTLLESKISLQNAVDLWKLNPQNAQLHITEAIKSAEETLQSVWMLVVGTLALFIAILVCVMLAVLVFLKRSRTKLATTYVEEKTNLSEQMHKLYRAFYVKIIFKEFKCRSPIRSC